MSHPMILFLCSDSCVKLFELVEECLKEAAESESEVAAGRLFQTALNMMQLFVLTAPRQHEAQLSSIPLMTGKPSLLLCCYSYCTHFSKLSDRH